MASFSKSFVFVFGFLQFVNSQDWRYTSPSNREVNLAKDWAKAYPLCGGNTQSPRHISTKNTKYDRSVCHGNMEIKFADVERVDMSEKKYAFNIVGENRNALTGLWEQLTDSKKSIGRFKNQFNPIKGINENYCFHSLHFHWSNQPDGKGSEHVVNNKQYVFEGHFVHFSCDYKDLNAAIAASSTAQDPYVLGVIGVMFEVGDRYNPAFRDMINSLKQIVKRHDNITNVKINNFNLNNLLPHNFDFYAYEGSLTTPPCFPIVRWHLLREPTYISVDQLRSMQSLKTSYTQYKNEVHNFRPPVFNKNTVYGCGLSFQPGHTGFGYTTGTDQPQSTISSTLLDGNGNGIFGNGNGNAQNVNPKDQSKISKLTQEKNIILGALIAVSVLFLLAIIATIYSIFHCKQKQQEEEERNYRNRKEKSGNKDYSKKKRDHDDSGRKKEDRDLLSEGSL